MRLSLLIAGSAVVASLARRRLLWAILIVANGCSPARAQDDFVHGGATRAFVELPALADDEMRVHFIDVGQGDATLLEFPCGVALIDAGGEESPQFDGESALQGYLEAFFIARPELNRSLDLLAITHPHPDHTLGLAMIARRYWVTHVIHNGQQAGGKGGRWQTEFLEQLEKDPQRFDPLGIGESDVFGHDGLTGPVIDPIGACDDSMPDPLLRALWGRLTAADSGSANVNNHSLVIRLDYGEFSMLFTGDLQSAGIRGLLRKFDANPSILDVDLYQVGHHGSHNGTTPGLMAAMTPDLSVCSMGPFERAEGTFTARRFAHPNVEAVEAILAGTRWERQPIECQVGIKGAFSSADVPRFEARTIRGGLFATGWDGNVVVTAKSDGRFRVWTERQGEVAIEMPDERVP